MRRKTLCLSYEPCSTALDISMQDSQFLNARRSISEPPVTLAAPFKLIPEAASGFGIFVSCLVVGGLILLGVLEGFYDMAFGMLLCIAASILVLTTLIWRRGARTLYRADVKRKQAEEALRESYDD